MKRVIALLMENQPGALSRVVGLFSQRGYNIETLVVAPTTDPTLSRLTMSTEGDEKVVEQITKQLNKLIDLIAFYFLLRLVLPQILLKVFQSK